MTLADRIVLRPTAIGSNLADGKSSLMVYGSDAGIAHASGSLSTEEARRLAVEIEDILTEAWGRRPSDSGMWV